MIALILAGAVWTTPQPSCAEIAKHPTWRQCERNGFECYSNGQDITFSDKSPDCFLINKPQVTIENNFIDHPVLGWTPLYPTLTDCRKRNPKANCRSVP